LNLQNLIVLVLVASVCGFIAERVVRGRLPYGLAGAIFAALLGAWLLVETLRWHIPGDMVAGGIPVFTAFLGAVVLIFLSTLLTTRPGLRRKRS
jgi:uncharacterized membrane protein YeaQ/YmgE (transglycosylase-associated protein family)